MLSEPLLLIILLLFLLLMSLVLLVWFMVTVRQRSVAASPKAPKIKAKPIKEEGSYRTAVKSQAAKPVRLTREAKLPAAEEAKLRLNNDQVRGLHTKATRRQVEEAPATEPPPSPKKADDDAFEKFIHSKNDDLKF
jgi:uncharacterized protein (DUF58 family)